MTCSEVGCPEPAVWSGYCREHYWMRFGGPENARVSTEEWRSGTETEPAPRITDLSGQQHGLAVACYRKHEGDVWPTIGCTCSMWFAAPTWQDAGSSFDDHLEDVSDGPA